MQSKLSGLLSNESLFGRLMTRCGIVIAANLLFVLFSFPVVTTGAAYAALYYVMLKALNGEPNLNPFRVFFQGFRQNFKQGSAVWLLALFFSGFVYIDLRICAQAAEPVALLRYPIYALCAALLPLLLCLFPTMAAFHGSIPKLFRGAFYFAMKKPLKTLTLTFFQVFPIVLTYTDTRFAPLYAFLWCFCGFGAVALLGAALFLPEFRPYLSRKDTAPPAPPTQSESEILKDMERLGM